MYTLALVGSSTDMLFEQQRTSSLHINLTMFVREYYPYTFFMSELEPLYTFHMVLLQRHTTKRSIWQRHSITTVTQVACIK